MELTDAQLQEAARRLHYTLETHPMLSGLMTREHQRLLRYIVEAINDPGNLTEAGIDLAVSDISNPPDYATEFEFIGAFWIGDTPYRQIPKGTRLQIGDFRLKCDELDYHDGGGPYDDTKPPEDSTPQERYEITDKHDRYLKSFVVDHPLWYRPVTG